jgi:cell wall-associated NlpC family hydrolase
MNVRSLDPDALQTGDLILSSDNSIQSATIRRATGSSYSHAMLYIGDGEVIDVTEDGVHVKPVHRAISGKTTSAVVLRHEHINPVRAMEVASIARSHVGAAYDWGGALVSPSHELCGTIGSAERFFCSELIIDAFGRAGMALTGKSPACSTPGDIWAATCSGALSYLGDLVSYESDHRGLMWNPTSRQTTNTDDEFCSPRDNIGDEFQRPESHYLGHDLADSDVADNGADDPDDDGVL